jgi:uncharacterized protein YbaP (TraB family)
MFHPDSLLDASNSGPRRSERNRRFFENRSLLCALTLISTLTVTLLSCTTESERVRLERQPPVSSAPPAASASPRNATPPFYRVDGGRGATLQLLGTIHLGPEEGWAFPPRIDDAIEAASSILVEVDLRDMTEEDASQAVMRHGILPAETPLSKVIGDETARLLEEHEDALTMSGAPPHIREAMQPWFIMMVLAETTIQQSGMSVKYSVEESLMETLGDRKVLSLETLDQQLAFFGELPIPVQELMLQQTLNEWDDAQSQLEEMVEAWRTHDEASLHRIAYDGIDEFPDLRAFYDVLVDGRNRSWVPRLIELLEDPKRSGTTVIAAVGALHLVGPAGVPSLLKEAGYRVSAPSEGHREKPGRP